MIATVISCSAVVDPTGLKEIVSGAVIESCEFPKLNFCIGVVEADDFAIRPVDQLVLFALKQFVPSELPQTVTVSQVLQPQFEIVEES